MQTAIKRIIDVAGAAIGLAFLAPLMLLITMAIRRSMGAPVLFRQPRAGRNGQPFQLLKFRSMTEARNTDGSFRSDRERLTPLGDLLRRTSLDELPQLWNVLKGDMSLVGPRPLLLQYRERYTCEQRRRLGIRPGITGWAQVNGRNTISWDQKFALDVWYVDHISIWLDFKILWLTLAKVWKRDGLEAAADLDRPEFMGADGNEEERVFTPPATDPPLRKTPTPSAAGSVPQKMETVRGSAY